jgi:hypothetical protein
MPDHVSISTKIASTYSPFGKGGRGLSPAGGGWGWSYIIKNPSKSPFTKGRLNRWLMVPHFHGNEGLPLFSFKLALINTTCKELLSCAQHCPFSSFSPAVVVYDALLKNIFYY